MNNNKINNIFKGLYHLLATTLERERANLVQAIRGARPTQVQLRWLTDRHGSPLRTLFDPAGAEYAAICESLRGRRFARWHAERLAMVGENCKHLRR
jgi:hypothetical protein